MSADVLAANTKAIKINKNRNNKKQLLLTSSCTRNGNWGDPFGVAVLENCFVRRKKKIILFTGNCSTASSKGTFGSTSSLATVRSIDNLH